MWIAALPLVVSAGPVCLFPATLPLPTHLTFILRHFYPTTTYHHAFYFSLIPLPHTCVHFVPFCQGICTPYTNSLFWTGTGRTLPLPPYHLVIPPLWFSLSQVETLVLVFCLPASCLPTLYSCGMGWFWLFFPSPPTHAHGLDISTPLFSTFLYRSTVLIRLLPSTLPWLLSHRHLFLPPPPAPHLLYTLFTTPVLCYAYYLPFLVW